MAGRGKITPAERRRQDYLRRRGLRTASVYEDRLAASRRKELRRVLKLALDLGDADRLPAFLEESIDETSYLPAWWTGLWTEAGLPMARTTAQTLRQAKAAAEDDIWLATLRGYAQTRAANNIVIVSGTWKDSLVRITRDNLAADLGLGIEKLTKRIYADYVQQLEKWQVRRIAQTEAMIGIADASALAAKTLDVPFVKQWSISGLGNTRESHEAMDGVTVDQDEPFVLPGGLLLYPHDTSLGADASEIINCACDCIRRSKASAVRTPSPVKPVVEPAPAPVPVQKPAQAPRPPKPKPAPAPAPAPAVAATAEEQRILSIMAEMDQSLPEATRRAIAENDIALEKALGVKKGKPMTIEKADKQSANPKFVEEFIPDPKGPYKNRKTGESFSKNPLYKASNKRYHVNCATCTPAYYLRERGFSVTAKGKVAGSINQTAARNWYGMWKNVDGTAAMPDTISKWMSGKGYLSMTEKRYLEYFEEVCKQDGTYAIGVSWKGGGGHATILKRTGGKLYYIEPQHYQEAKGMLRDVNEICAGATSSPRWNDGVLRLDDKLFDTSWASLFNTK